MHLYQKATLFLRGAPSKPRRFPAPTAIIILVELYFPYSFAFPARYKRGTESSRSLISHLGYSGFSEESGRSRSQAHLPSISGDSEPSSICTTYLPITGKNLNPWNEPQVARYRPFAAECGEMMKSDVVVKASLPGVNGCSCPG